MKKILIIGAGISGLYLANLLEKSGKYNYKILEKKNDLNLNEGYGIQLSVNGVKLLNRIGFRELALSEINYPNKINFCDVKNNRLISSIEISKFNNNENFYTTIKRSVLLKLLIKNIPKEKIVFGSNIKSIEQNSNFKINFINNSCEEASYLALCDGVFSKSKNMVLGNVDNVKYYKAVAIRGMIKNQENKDISLYLGPNFHFVIYSINQKNEANFISIIREKNLKKIQSGNKNSLALEYLDKIIQNSSFNLKDKLEQISLYPIFVSKKLIKPQNNRIYFGGDALYTYPPSFAQGASQSIESSYDIFKSLEGDNINYYQEREIKINQVKLRSQFNHYAFHISNPFVKLARNIALKYLTKNEKFLEGYLGKIYR